MGKRQLTMVIGVLSFVLVGTLVYLYMLIGQAGDMWPATNEPGTLVNQINGLDRDINTLNTEVAKIPAAKETLEVMRVEYDLATRVLPLATDTSPDHLIAAIRTKA
ncbi:MAG: hypothetical protein LIP77_09830, partial [Planctomycetes bacterium]|nr:hypothetical protein [Planctomycetota bacterium]